MKGTDIYIDNIVGENVRQLFLNVVLRAVKDAFYTKETDVTLLQQYQARTWLCNGSPDFYEVCMLAGLNGEGIRRKSQCFCKMRKDKINKYGNKIMNSKFSQEEKNMMLLDSLANGEEFMFYETIQGKDKKSKILVKAFELCEKGDIDLNIKRNGNKIQYFATGRKE